jgi:hypothetical protein
VWLSERAVGIHGSARPPRRQIRRGGRNTGSDEVQSGRREKALRETFKHIGGDEYFEGIGGTVRYSIGYLAGSSESSKSSKSLKSLKLLHSRAS